MEFLGLLSNFLLNKIVYAMEFSEWLSQIFNPEYEYVNTFSKLNVQSLNFNRLSELTLSDLGFYADKDMDVDINRNILGGLIRRLPVKDEMHEVFASDSLGTVISDHLTGGPHNLYISAEQSDTGATACDYTISYYDVNMVKHFHTFIEVKGSLPKTSWYKVTEQASKYLHTDHGADPCFLILCNGSKLAFFEFHPYWHSANHIPKHVPAEGLIGLYSEPGTWIVKPIPQMKGYFFAECKLYDMYERAHWKPIDSIFTYMRNNASPPVRDINLNGHPAWNTNSVEVFEKTKIAKNYINVYNKDIRNVFNDQF